MAVVNETLESLLNEHKVCSRNWSFGGIRPSLAASSPGAEVSETQLSSPLPPPGHLHVAGVASNRRWTPAR